MRTEKLRHLYAAEPFQPFTIRLADGRALAVKHREFLAISPTGATAVLYQPDGSFNLVDVRLVADLEVSTNGKRA
jgi:hypothetical protein